MGTVLEIIGNHKIDFDRPENVIKQFEKLSGFNVEDGTHKTISSIEESTNELEIKFYCSYEHLEYNFEKWKMVKILSNYKPCHEITINKKTILFSTNLMIKHWRSLLLNELNDESLKINPQHIREGWILLELFSKTMIKNLKGTHLLFLSDTYENIMDACNEGEIELQDMLEILTKEYSSTQHKWIQEIDLKKRLLHFGWLNMIIDKNKNWLLDPNKNLKK